MDAIVLCGGKGTRLASVVSNVPKPLASVNGRPFLDYLLTYLASSGLVSRVILATGFLAEKIESHYGDSFASMPVVYSREIASLGTAGAVMLALRSYSVSAQFLILNGDSFIDADLNALVSSLSEPDAVFSLSLYEAYDVARFGTVLTDGIRVTNFVEKAGYHIKGLINAGVYAAKHDCFDQWLAVQGSVSLEQEIFPLLVQQGSVIGVQTGQYFIDIGLPETYSAASSFFQDKVIHN